jgi:hypothetical protein
MQPNGWRKKSPHPMAKISPAIQIKKENRKGKKVPRHQNPAKADFEVIYWVDKRSNQILKIIMKKKKSFFEHKKSRVQKHSALKF